MMTMFRTYIIMPNSQRNSKVKKFRLPGATHMAGGVFIIFIK